MTRNKIKIVAVGLHVSGTGFTRVFESIFNELQSEFEIHWVAIGYKGSIQELEYTVYPCNVNGGDMYGAYQAQKLAFEIEADYVLVLNDLWMMKNYAVTLNHPNRTWQNCAYIPLDGLIKVGYDLTGTHFLDHIILYNDVAKNNVEWSLANSSLQTTSSSQNIHVIGHGVDHSAFFPLDPNAGLSKMDIRKSIFKDVPKIEDQMIILNANRYVIRKNIQGTLRAYADFVHMSNPESILCLHMPGTHEELLLELSESIQALGIQSKVVLNPLGNSYCSNEDLNLLYNACDVGLNTSFGEGWGLIAFEHACTGALQIMTGTPILKSIWKENASFISADEEVVIEGNPFTMNKIDECDLSQQLTGLYQNKEDRRLRAIQSQQFAESLEHWSWKSIAIQWSELFKTYIPSCTLKKTEVF